MKRLEDLAESEDGSMCLCQDNHTILRTLWNRVTIGMCTYAYADALAGLNTNQMIAIIEEVCGT